MSLIIGEPKDKELTEKLNQYPKGSPLKNDIEKWSSMDTTQYMLQLCVPYLDKDSRLIRYSAEPLCLFLIENGKFKTYQGIVGERNIKS